MRNIVGGLGIVLACMVLVGFAASDDASKSKFAIDFEAFFQKLDADKDGKLSRTEFLQMADRAKEKEKARAKLAKVFDMLDPANKGITKEQFKTFLDTKKPAGK